VGNGLTHVPCGVDGWGHLIAVIDCNEREITGFEFALLGRAKEAERALEEACLARFGPQKTISAKSKHYYKYETASWINVVKLSKTLFP
jgi:hypothetical protein